MLLVTCRPWDFRIVCKPSGSAPNRPRQVQFYSRENATPGYRPRLVINGQTFYATEDATVTWGSNASANFGSAGTLTVCEGWDDTATTYNNGMEFDIWEALGIWGADNNSNTLHWNGYGADHQSIGKTKYAYPASADGFHVFGMNWQAGHVDMYVDGLKTWTYDNARVSSVPEDIILSLQLGGWDNNTPGAQVNNQEATFD